MYITLRCINCDNPNCDIGRYFIPDESKEGCTRLVTEEQAYQLEHYTKEVLPFISIYKNNDNAQQELNKIYSFLSNIYNCPLGQIIDAEGKIITNPKIVYNRLHKEPK